MFNDSVGAINAQVIPLFAKIFPFLDGVLIPWKTDPTWTKIALIMMQGWLGFPYIYVLTLGILQFQTIFTKLLILMVPMVGKNSATSLSQ